LLLALGAGGALASVVLSGLSTSFRHAQNSEPACASVNSRLNSISNSEASENKILRRQQIETARKTNQSTWGRDQLEQLIMYTSLAGGELLPRLMNCRCRRDQQHGNENEQEAGDGG
jgi:hypothetical protein